MAHTKAEVEYLRRLGTAIRQSRRKKGWSQERLSFECELHRTYVGAVERGERNISILNLTKITDALGTTLPRLTEGIKKDSKE